MLEILGIIAIFLLVLPLLFKARKFDDIERRHEMRRSLRKLQGKYTHY